MGRYERLVGTWRMLSLRVELTDTGEILEPWGPSPPAFLILTPAGRLITVGTARDRAIPASDQDAAAVLNSMVCYSGKTWLEGEDRFVTEVDVAWHPSWVGTRQARSFTLDGDILSVRTDVISHPSHPGRPLQFILRWQRGD